jgi:hypothetical protein
MIGTMGHLTDLPIRWHPWVTVWILLVIKVVLFCKRRSLFLRKNWIISGEKSQAVFNQLQMVPNLFG